MKKPAASTEGTTPTVRLGFSTLGGDAAFPMFEQPAASASAADVTSSSNPRQRLAFIRSPFSTGEEERLAEGARCPVDAGPRHLNGRRSAPRHGPSAA